MADTPASVVIAPAAELQVSAVATLDDGVTEVSATPVLTLGQPRNVRLGVRYGR